MERGGLTSLCLNIGATHHASSSFSCWPLRTRSGSMWHHRTALSLPCVRRLHRSSLMASGSFESPEVKLENEESMKKDKLLIDCEEDEECVLGLFLHRQIYNGAFIPRIIRYMTKNLGGIVALGKFDALHVGHRHLAISASKAGTPFLLSFVGMAEVLGWEPRPPIVAKCDRKRVLKTWAPYCGNIIPIEYQVEFSKVRYLTPRQFVEKLSNELRVSGVVAGENYRFGYKASGDASELIKLCKEFNLQAFIVSSVMDNNTQKSYNGSSKTLNPNDKGQVSSSRVRHALSNGDMDYVSQLLGRKHRLIMKLNDKCQILNGQILVPRFCLLNQAPMAGLYENCTIFVDEFFIGLCRVVIDEEMIQIESKDIGGFLNVVQNSKVLGVEFG